MAKRTESKNRATFSWQTLGTVRPAMHLIVVLLPLAIVAFFSLGYLQYRLAAAPTSASSASLKPNGNADSTTISPLTSIPVQKQLPLPSLSPELAHLENSTSAMPGAEQSAAAVTLQSTLTDTAAPDNAKLQAGRGLLKLDTLR